MVTPRLNLSSFIFAEEIGTCQLAEHSRASFTLLLRWGLLRGTSVHNEEVPGGSQCYALKILLSFLLYQVTTPEYQAKLPSPGPLSFGFRRLALALGYMLFHVIGDTCTLKQ